ncbi:hypothetical protein ABZ646_12430 [Streptomyces sp. NPDC007162]|uniref:hypothetical protein n=1 Tax=Streptomyces sp. NPDC007162 TaxID=3156917 RepID=UPI0033D9A7B6
MGLREAAGHHLPYPLAALRYARADDRTFPGPFAKRGAELLALRRSPLTAGHAGTP